MPSTPLAAAWEAVVGIQLTPLTAARVRSARILGAVTLILALLCIADQGGAIMYLAIPPLDRVFRSGQLGMVLLSAALGLWIMLRVPWRSVGPVEQRRSRILVTLVVALIIQSLLVAPTDQRLWRLDPHDFTFWVGLLLLCFQIRWLAINGQVGVAASVMVITFILYLVPAASQPDPITTVAVPYVQVLIILCAGLLVRPWAGLVLAAVLPLSGELLHRLIEPGYAVAALPIVLRSVFLLVIAAIVALYARSLERALWLADQQASDLLVAREALTAQNAQLRDQQLALERSGAALAETIAQQDVTIAGAVAALRDRSVEIMQIQTPLIRVAPGVLVAPLAGSWNAERADQFRFGLLRTIEQQRVRSVVLDLTGAQLASADLVELIRRVTVATPLLGCICVIAGVAPELAQELVHVQVNLEHVQTVADLAEALQLV